jgi:hypothetical protein
MPPFAEANYRQWPSSVFGASLSYRFRDSFASRRDNFIESRDPRPASLRPDANLQHYGDTPVFTFSHIPAALAS